MDRRIIVIKKGLDGQETWRYEGSLIHENHDCIVLEAYFNRSDMQFNGILLSQGDRFVETFYTNRWYNIFEIHDRETDELKGWYCNICCPAARTDDTISYIDLALDLLVFPDGRQLVLDQDEFEALDLDPTTKKTALKSLQHLQNTIFQ